MAKTQEEHVQAVKEKAQALIEVLNEATDEGVSQAILIPELVALFRDAGMVPQL